MKEYNIQRYEIVPHCLIINIYHFSCVCLDQKRKAGYRRFYELPDLRRQALLNLS